MSLIKYGLLNIAVSKVSATKEVDRKRHINTYTRKLVEFSKLSR